MKLSVFTVYFFLLQITIGQTYFLNQSNGLPCNYFEDIIKSSDGFIWLIAGSDGIIKYDGDKFIKYTKKNGLLSNNCYGIVEDGDNKLWIANDSGLTAYDDGQFYTFSKNEGFPENTVTCSIFCDSKNDLWVGTFEGKLIQFDGKKFSLKKVPFKNQVQEIEFIGETKKGNLLLGNVYGSLFFYDKKNFWDNLNNKEIFDEDLCCGINFIFTRHDRSIIIGTPKNLFLFENEKNIFEIKFDYKKWGSPVYITQEQDNSYWLLTLDNNLLHIDILDNKIQILKSIDLNEFTTDELLSFTNIGNIFFITTYSSGILVYRDFKKKYFPFHQIGIKSVPTILKSDTNDNLYFAGRSYFGIISAEDVAYFHNFSKVEYNITDILRINKNNFVFAADGFGLVSYNLKSGALKYLSKKNQNSLNYITHLEKSLNDTLWISSEELIAKYKDDVYEKYMLNSNDRIVPYDETEYFKPLVCQKILSDSINNRLWIASYIKLFYYQNGKFYSVDNPEIKNIFDIISDKNQNLWILEDGNNLFRYNVQNKTVKNFSKFIKNVFKDIEDNSLFQIRIDKNNQLWINARIALQIDSNSNIIERNNYFSHPYFNNHFICSLQDVSDNYIWLTTDHDIQQIPISNLYNITKIPAPIISGVKINDLLSNLKTVDYKKNFWSFQFSLPYFSTNHDNILYYYQLVGIDNEWHYQVGNSDINYYYLPPGDYEFRIKSQFYDQEFSSNIIKYHFTISPPFWKTYWFLLILISIFLFIIFIFLKIRTIKIKEKAFILNRINYLKLKVLQSQIKPHFLFNFLNNIQENILNNDKEIIIEHLSLLSKFIRETLEYSDFDQITVKQELKYIENYIMIEKFRFNNEFEFNFEQNNSQNINKIYLPPMILQPLVENAIIHGLKPSKLSHKMLSVVVNSNLDKTTIEIIDNGVGFNHDSSNKVSYNMEKNPKGLNLIKEKLHVYSIQFPAERIELDFKDLNESGNAHGTKITLTIFSKND